MDYLTINALRVRGVHGCHAREGVRPQDFLVTLRAGVDARAPGVSDALADAVDFDFLKQAILGVFAGARHRLVESLAEEIAANILADERVRDIEVSIQKPEVWGNGVPGVSIRRARARSPFQNRNHEPIEGKSA